MTDRIQGLLPQDGPRKKSRTGFWRRIISILVSVGILAFYFSRVRWPEVSNSLMNANLWLFLPARLFPVLLYLFVDSFLLQRIIIWFHCPISYSKVTYGRASLYLLAMINPQVSNGGMFLYLMRRAEIGAEKLLGLVAFRFAWTIWTINFGVTLALCFTEYFGLPFHSPVGLQIIIGGIACLWATLLGYLAFVAYLNRFQPDRKHRPIWTAFIQGKPRHYLVIVGCTLPLAICGVISNYLCALSYGINIPLHEMIILLPIADFIAALPIAFLGLGTTTFAWQNLFRPFATPAMFLSFTITLPVTTYIFRAIIALIALPRASSEFELALFKSNHEKSKKCQ